MTVPKDKALAVKKEVQNTVAKNADVLKATGITPAAFERIALNAFMQTPQLANCTRVSIASALTKAITTKLLPDGYSAALVPLKNRRKNVTEAQFWPMVGGLLTKARQAKGMKDVSISAHCVWASDTFKVQRGSVMSILHEDDEAAEHSWENLHAVYAIAFHAGNPVPEFEVMYKPEIVEFRKASPAGGGGPWATHWAEMAETRPLKRLLKRFPIGADLVSLLQEDEEDDSFAAAAGETKEVSERPQRAERPAQKPRERTTAPTPEPEYEATEFDHDPAHYAPPPDPDPSEGETDPAELDF